MPASRTANSPALTALRGGSPCPPRIRVIQDPVSGPDDTLQLRFTDAADAGRKVVPAAALARALDALQRLALLLGRRRDGQMPRQRFKPSRAEQERYRLVCEVPQPSSYLQPVRLEGSHLLSPTETGDVFEGLTRVLATAGRDDEAELEREISDDTWRRYILDAVERLAPPPELGVALEIARNGTVLCTGDSIRRFAENAARRPRAQGHSAVVGEFKRIDFLTHQITIRHRETSRELVCTYEDGIEASLLEHPRELILVFGLVTRDADGAPLSIDAVDHIEPVDLAPIIIDGFQVDGLTVRSRPPIELAVTFDSELRLLTAIEPELGIDASGERRDDLDACVRDELVVLWKHYAQATEDALAPDALALKNRLLARWKAEGNAA